MFVIALGCVGGLLTGCGREKKPAAIRGRGQSSFVAEAQAQFAASMKLPDGYQVA